MNYYNELDANAAAWLRQLIAENLIPPGEVDERNITDVSPTDLLGYTQCHFFAGVGGWSLALRLAGWPDDRPVWTGSCPCQPFSTAGKRKGVADDRDLWPEFFRLISECRPAAVFGEQVSSADVVGSSQEAAFVDAVRAGNFARANKLAHQISRSASLHYHYRWLDRVHADLEGAGYAVRSEVLGAHSVGAPHRRQRLYWGAALLADRDAELRDRAGDAGTRGRRELADDGNGGGMADAEGVGNIGKPGGVCSEDGGPELDQVRQSAINGHSVCGVDDPESRGRGIYGDASYFRETDGEVDPPANPGNRSGGVAQNADGRGRGGRDHGDQAGSGREIQAPGLGGHGGMADSLGAGLEGYAGNEGNRLESGRNGAETAGSTAAGGVPGLSPWAESRFILCRDGKIRRIPAESLLFGVADGVSEGVDGSGAGGISDTGGFPLTRENDGRAMLLKGYGNAIVPQLAAEFVEAFAAAMKTEKENGK